MSHALTVVAALYMVVMCSGVIGSLSSSASHFFGQKGLREARKRSVLPRPCAGGIPLSIDKVKIL